MKKFIILGLLGLAACSGGPRYNGPRIPLKANPSGIIAAELAFNRLAQEKGQWTSFRETMAKDAVMFVPERVLAAEWLKDRADPAQSVTWQPHQVWTSCDGSAGITHGAWQQADGPHGYYTTAWQRQTDGSYKWTLDHGVPLQKAEPVKEMIGAKVAACKGAPFIPVKVADEGVDLRIHLSRDQTLRWVSAVNPDLSRTISVHMWNGTSFDDVLVDHVDAPAKP